MICAIVFYNTKSTGQLIKDKNSFIRATITVYDSRVNGFDSISTPKNLGADKGFEPKIFFPEADECFIRQRYYYAVYSFKDSNQAISFFKEVQGLLTEASTAYNAMVRFTSEPGNPYYLKFHIGNAEAFLGNPDLISMFQDVLSKDYKIKGGIPLSGTDKIPANPYSLYLIFNGAEPETAYFTSQGNRIINNEIISLVKEVGFGKDTQMLLIKNKKIARSGNNYEYESKRTLKGYTAKILEADYREDQTSYFLSLKMELGGKNYQEVLQKGDSLILSLKAALPASYCYIIQNNYGTIHFYSHPFANEKPDAIFMIDFPKSKEDHYSLSLTIARISKRKNNRN